MTEQDEQSGNAMQQSNGGETPSSDTGDIHRPRPAVERKTEDGTAGQGLGQVSGATREDAQDEGLKNV
ncbi:MAG TPA: hypothetical protein VD835_12715 [Pyrinomonadaceae bacterium]|nr:hypothetical protein [Pyrinomonadaceae bacterium]